MFSRTVRCPVFAAPVDGLRTCVVERPGVPVEHLGEVGTDRVRVGRLRPGRGHRRHGLRADDDEALSLFDGVAFTAGDLRDHAAGRCDDVVLHLHRLEDDDSATLLDELAFAHDDADDGALHRSDDRDRLVGHPPTLQKALLWAQGRMRSNVGLPPGRGHT